MYLKILIILFAILIILTSFINYGTLEEFSFVNNLKNNPLGAVGQQVGAFWRGVEPPLTWSRNIFYNISPNYTWLTRFYDKSNDRIRANKGMPPLLPSPTNSSKVNFDFKTNENVKSYLLNRINKVSPTFFPVPP